MTQYGSEAVIYPLDDKGSTISVVSTYRKGKAVQTLRQYRVHIKVQNSQEEMTEFIRFTDEIAKHRVNGTLSSEWDDPTSQPAFIIKYPRENVDGSYFVIKCYRTVDIDK